MYIVIRDGLRYVRIDTERTVLPYIYKDIEVIREEERILLRLKKEYRFEDGSSLKALKVQSYLISTPQRHKDLMVYVYENADGFDDYTVYEKLPFVYASNRKATLYTSDPYLKGKYLYLKGRVLETNSEELTVNDRPYRDEELKEGDRISLLNFVCYYYEDLLYMNGFMMTSRLPRKEMAEVVCRYEHERPKLSVRFLNTRKELVIPELREYSPIVYPKERSIMFQIGPGITMSLAMLGVAGIIVYSNYLNGQPLLNSLIYILMPLTMLVSGILWPLLTRAAERKTRNREEDERKNSYLDYLQEYENRITDLIRKYLKQERSYYFEGTVDKEKIFNITRDDPSFLQISIGTVTEKRELDFKDPGNTDIRDVLEGIRHRLQNIVGCPFFLDLKKYRAISICTERSQKINMLKKTMLELSYKYYYDDLYLALYSEDLDPFADLFGLPQLIYADSRLTLNRKSELQELNSLKFDRPLILLVNDRIDVSFTNTDIRVIYFSCDMNEVYRGSEVLIEYLDRTGHVYEDDIVTFSYEKPDNTFKENAALLSPYQKMNFIDREPAFGDVFTETDIRSF